MTIFPASDLGSSVGEPQLARALEPGQVLPAVGQERLGQRRATLDAGGRDHDGHRPLAEVGVGHADDGGVGHGRMVEEDVLRLPGIDVDAPADDQVAVPVGEEEVAVVVEPADVADAEAGAGGVVGGRRLLRVAEVAEAVLLRRGVEEDPADGAGRAGLARVVEDPDPAAPPVAPDGARAAPATPGW